MVGNKNEIKYKGKLITKLFPSGYYEVYSDIQGRFVKFDDLENAKSLIDSEKKSSGGSMAKGGKVEYDDNDVSDRESVMDVFNNWVKPYFDKQGYLLQYNTQDKDYIYVTAIKKGQGRGEEIKTFLIFKKHLFFSPP